ncbi:ATP-binding protein [Desulfofustis glycolicus]|uniref:AAA-like domain-containing protein n=1 Tax=Desulfofustis glycolicus DSM 9705 TaxID=1121409 RepID=A0A1M5SAS3_9BACT|nr:DUF87 domain-containing protein [Desulfofustis glycolicus]MCB2216179.1 DUF87 domain-containing protein [Desulfobulbaceae bacterium]SHH35596.1 AAA-like domain-containing protein [Desulfofustis glycolicus DSM 9705]
MDTSRVYEKLGLFYLGREVAVGDGTPSELPFLLKSKDLTTHGVIIGMTGSGKTGLGVGLIEEAIMDDIPSIIVDPKGDMANLLLTFPQLQGEDFTQWIDPAEASRKNMTIDELADQTARTWRDGLASWDQGSERIEALHGKTEMTVYTPGSGSGAPVSILSGFAAPDEQLLRDQDGLQALVGSTVTSLLSLVRVEGDPLTSREHILVSSILLHYWRNGQDLTMESLIGALVNPPFETVGVFSLAQFFPQNDRMTLAMKLNNVIASPSFASWLQGDPLDVQQLLYGDEGRPRTAIFSIAHLSEAERMFFVTLLLNAVISWMRRQQGTSSLKALFYMDEIFGYFPPTANPPSKRPMLLLLKQARAYGLGVVLATQNPVDLDYKGLANIGSWFIGRLQTAQDQDRVLDGIVGAGSGFSRNEVRTLLADMKGRRFILASAHRDEPLLFETRWVMSYLKGPIGLPEIATLMKGRRGSGGAASMVPADRDHWSGQLSDQTPLLSNGIDQRYCQPPLLVEQPVFQPWLAVAASVRFYQASRAIDEVRHCSLRVPLDESFARIDWQAAEPLAIDLDSCADAPPSNSLFRGLPAEITAMRDLRAVEREFADYLYQMQRLELLRAPAVKLESRPGERAADFRVRIGDVLREQKDEAAEKVLTGFARKREQLAKRLEAAYLKVDKERGDVSARKTDSLISFGTAILGAVLGRKALSTTTMTRTAGTIRSVGRVAKEKQDVRRAEEAAALIEQQINELDAEQQEAIAALADTYDPARVETETISLKPRRADIFEVRACLLWEMVPPPAPLHG